MSRPMSMKVLSVLTYLKSNPNAPTREITSAFPEYFDRSEVASATLTDWRHRGVVDRQITPEGLAQWNITAQGEELFAQFERGETPQAPSFTPPPSRVSSRLTREGKILQAMRNGDTFTSARLAKALGEHGDSRQVSALLCFMAKKGLVDRAFRESRPGRPRVHWVIAEAGLEYLDMRDKGSRLPKKRRKKTGRPVDGWRAPGDKGASPVRAATARLTAEEDRMLTRLADETRDARATVIRRALHMYDIALRVKQGQMEDLHKVLAFVK